MSDNDRIVEELQKLREETNGKLNQLHVEVNDLSVSLNAILGKLSEVKSEIRQLS